jgi:hypothetical protein
VIEDAVVVINGRDITGEREQLRQLPVPDPPFATDKLETAETQTEDVGT